MRDIRQGNCPHHEIVQVHPNVFGFYHLKFAPMGAAQRVDPPTADRELNVFVCRGCWFAQWYAVAPGGIPIAAERGTRLIKGSAPAGPYR